MKPFVIDSSMTSIGGTFYPTGHVFALYPDEEGVRQVAAALLAADHEGAVAHASPEVIMRDIVRTLGTPETPLPSVGAEDDLVRRIADLATKGHHGALITVASNDTMETVASALTQTGAVAAFYYRTFIIEDLVTQTAERGEQSVVVGTLAAERRKR